MSLLTERYVTYHHSAADLSQIEKNFNGSSMYRLDAAFSGHRLQRTKSLDVSVHKDDVVFKQSNSLGFEPDTFNGLTLGNETAVKWKKRDKRKCSLPERFAKLFRSPSAEKNHKHVRKCLSEDYSIANQHISKQDGQDHELVFKATMGPVQVLVVCLLVSIL